MKKQFIMMTVAIAAITLLNGCGGGGGSGTTSNVNPSYKGNTTQANLTTNNAKVLTVDAVGEVQNVSSVGVLNKVITETADTYPNIQQISNTLKNKVFTIYTKTTTDKNIAKTVAASAQTTEYGYNGSYNAYITGNDTTGIFSGSITFNSYREFSYSPSFSGIATFNGSANTNTGDLINLNMTLSDIHILDGSESFTLNGTLGVTDNNNTSKLFISMVMTDNTTAQTYWLKDFNIDITSNVMTINGTYYDYTYGYVVISTVNPLYISTYSDSITAGQLLFNGSNGTKARLTYTSSGYILEVDANGNNVFTVVP